MWPTFEALLPGDAGGCFDKKMSFDCSASIYKVSAELPYTEPCQIWLIRQITFVAEAFVSWQEPILFEDFLFTLAPLAPPAPPARGGGDHRRLSRDWWARLLEEFPWLTEDDIPREVHGPGHAGGHGHDAREPVRRALDPDRDEAVAVDVKARLLARRKEWGRDFFRRLVLRPHSWRRVDERSLPQ